MASYEAYRKLIPEHERIDDIRTWLRARLAHMRTEKPQTSFLAWCGSESLADQIQRYLESLTRHPDDCPIQPETSAQLRCALDAMRADLAKTRPF